MRSFDNHHPRRTLSLSVAFRTIAARVVGVGRGERGTIGRDRRGLGLWQGQGLFANERMVVRHGHGQTCIAL